MSVTCRRLKDQINLHRDMRPRLARHVRDQFVTQLYVDTPEQIGRRIRNKSGLSHIAEQILITLGDWT